MSEPVAFHIGDPWFEHIITGQKIVEGKLAKGKALNMEVGSVLHISGNTGEVIECRVVAIRRYESFRNYLETEGLTKSLPGVTSIEDGLNVYNQYYQPGLDLTLGVLAVELFFVGHVTTA